MFNILKNRRLHKNIFFAGITLILLFFLWLRYLDFYTNHNNVIKVPDFNDLHISNLDSITEAHNLRYEIIDSIFDKSRQKGVVVNQDPLANMRVKENRRIYLTINSLQSRKINFPDIYDLTLRQAVRKLNKNGLNVGKLEYKADIATNKVLDFKINGIKLKAGQELYHGTVVDLVVGKGLSNEKVTIPNLIGLSRLESNIILKSTSLNVGMEYFGKDILDSNIAVVYKQYPISNDLDKMSIGGSIDLYFESSSKENL